MFEKLKFHRFSEIFFRVSFSATFGVLTLIKATDLEFHSAIVVISTLLIRFSPLHTELICEITTQVRTHLIIIID